MLYAFPFAWLRPRDGQHWRVALAAGPFVIHLAWFGVAFDVPADSAILPAVVAVNQPVAEIERLVGHSTDGSGANSAEGPRSDVKN